LKIILHTQLIVIQIMNVGYYHVSPTKESGQNIILYYSCTLHAVGVAVSNMCFLPLFQSSNCWQSRPPWTYFLRSLCCWHYK